jgi:hypothetical protein
MAPFNHNWATLTTNCFRAAKTVGYYINYLRIVTIMPQDLEFTEHTFCDLMEKVSSLPYISVSLYACGVYNCGCQSETTYNLSSDLQREVKLIEEQQKTLICLDCLKTDMKSKEEGKCRISHS